MENLYFITVNYNSHKSVKGYIDSIIKKDNIYLKKFIVVDNASKKEDLESLKSEFKNRDDVIILENKNNIGYFKGLNIGLDYLKNNNLESKFVIIGNNDIEFNDDFFENLNKTNVEENVLVLAPNVVTLNGIYQNPHVINRVSSFRKKLYDLYYTNYYIGSFIMKIYNKYLKNDSKKKVEVKDEMDIYMGIGAIYILSKNFFEKFSRLNDNVFLWGEEALLGNQILSCGGKIRYIPNLKVKHLENICTGKIASKEKYIQMKESYKIHKKFL
ncbi:glycosyltransferase [Clostridium perfringens]|nr:glycosyltransferase family 2 protein [Clostridium perfringens]EJT6666003.1 glycosyltransferase family 2 protein [Clostridium perfringens]